jgi:phage baseplate assembly protein W
MTTEYEVTPFKDGEDYNFEATGAEAIAQNVRTIISTWRGSVFLMREFGLNPAIIDQPGNMVLANLTMDITNQINRYESRVEVTGLSFGNGDTVGGEIVPTVTFRLKEGVLL